MVVIFSTVVFIGLKLKDSQVHVLSNIRDFLRDTLGFL